MYLSIFLYRHLDVTVWTQVRAPLLMPIDGDATTESCGLMRFHEVIPDHYDILWDSYKHSYHIVDMSDGDDKNSYSTNIAEDRPLEGGFNYIWTNSECKQTEVDMQWMIDLNNNMSHDMMATNGACLRTLSYNIPIPPHHTILTDNILSPQRFLHSLNSYRVVVTTTFRARKRLLTRAAQPIDASRGFVVPPSLLVIISPTNNEQLIYTTPSFLVTSSIPDASMPYNVITLVR